LDSAASDALAYGQRFRLRSAPSIMPARENKTGILWMPVRLYDRCWRDQLTTVKVWEVWTPLGVVTVMMSTPEAVWSTQGMPVASVAKVNE